MKLLSILLAIMTFTVKSKTTVEMDGSWPYDITVDYQCSYQKGDVRAGDEATLSLGNLGGLTIEQVEVWVNSNKAAGAGVFSVSANGENIATKEGSLKEWIGKFDNEDYHPIALLNRNYDDVDSLVVSLTGTTNSLHIQKFVITYAPRPAHSVTLMSAGTEFAVLTEEHGMSGVELPRLEDMEYWKFRGWSETEFWEVSEWPALLMAGKRYYPETDCTLWAVYEYDDSPEMVYATDLVSGRYRYVNNALNIALTGVPADGMMQPASLDLANTDQVYAIDFLSSGRATITHAASGTPIGYNGSQLAVKLSEWSVYQDGEEVLFYTTISGKTYILWLNIPSAGYATMLYTGLLQTTLQTSPMRLMPVKEEQEPVLSCHPEQKVNIESVESGDVFAERVVMHFGEYDLVIKNGQKELRVKR